MRELTLGFALCGSFCTFGKAMEQMRRTAGAGYRLVPIMSNNAYETDTRFGRACDFIWEAEDICGRKVIHSIAGAEAAGTQAYGGRTCYRALHRKHTGKAGGRDYRYSRDNGSQVLSEDWTPGDSLCRHERCSCRVGAEYRKADEHKKYLFCPVLSGRSGAKTNVRRRGFQPASSTVEAALKEGSCSRCFAAKRKQERWPLREV